MEILRVVAKTEVIRPAISKKKKQKYFLKTPSLMSVLFRKLHWLGGLKKAGRASGFLASFTAFLLGSGLLGAGLLGAGLLCPHSAAGQDPTRRAAPDLEDGPTQRRYIPQNKFPIGGQGSFTHAIGLPSGQFEDLFGKRSYGLSLYIALKSESLPLYGGIDLRASRFQAHTVEVGRQAVERGGRFYQPLFSFRFQRPSGRVRPFVETVAGANILATKAESSGGGPASQFREEQVSVGLAVGGGVGVDFRAVRLLPFGVLGLNVSVQYVYGSETEALFLQPGSDENLQNGEDLPTERIETSVIQPKMGLYFEF